MPPILVAEDVRVSYGAVGLKGASLRWKRDIVAVLKTAGKMTPKSHLSHFAIDERRYQVQGEDMRKYLVSTSILGYPCAGRQEDLHAMWRKICSWELRRQG